MGRIADIIPSLYYRDENKLIDFINALDAEISNFERQVKSIPDLLNVDKCPDDKLPYLAALTNCPLIGKDPTFWRRQIKNWPYILKLKGTKRSLEIVLDSIGAASWDIETFFRDAAGGYVTYKPEGKPFKDFQGIWRNSRTHYFGIKAQLSKAFAEAEDYSWDVDELKEKLSFWLDHGKPYHAELLNMVILPPQFPPEDHICIWDFCDWEHPPLRIYDWGVFNFEDAFDDYLPFGRKFDCNNFTISDTAYFDLNGWDSIPVRYVQFRPGNIYGVVCDIDWGDEYQLRPEKTLTWSDFPWTTDTTWNEKPNVKFEKIFGNVTLWDYSRWGYSTISAARVFGKIDRRIFNAAINWTAENSGFAPITHRGFVFDGKLKWGKFKWNEGYTWLDKVKQLEFRNSPFLGFYANLEYDEPRKNFPPTILDFATWDFLSKTQEQERKKITRIENTRTFERVISALIKWDAPALENSQEHAISQTEFPEITSDLRQGKVTGIPAALEWTFDKKSNAAIIWDDKNWDTQQIFIKGNAPKPKWSDLKKWKKSKTWKITTEQCATGSFSTWKGI